MFDVIRKTHTGVMLYAISAVILTCTVFYFRPTDFTYSLLLVGTLAAATYMLFYVDRYDRVIQQQTQQLQETIEGLEQAYDQRIHLLSLLIRHTPYGAYRARVKDKTGKEGNYVYLDLPSGPIRFIYRDEDHSLFSSLPEYTQGRDGRVQDVGRQPRSEPAIARASVDPKEIQTAFQTLQTALQKDSAYAWAWHCNLAMPIKDEGTELEFANRAAARIMQTLFSIDTTQNPHYRFTPAAVAEEHR